MVSGDTLIERLAFTLFVVFIKTDDPPKRSFYEIECIRGIWSVKELKRQINSLYYERSGLSLFVSRYQVELPKKEAIQCFIEKTIKEIDDGKLMF